MKDMGFIHYFLGLEVWQGDGEIFVGHGEVHYKDYPEISYAGLWAHGHASSRKLEEFGCQ